MMGLGRTGSSASNGSGDYVIAFSTAASVRRSSTATQLTTTELSNGDVDAVFQAVVEATEESVLNALMKADTMVGINGNRVHAIPYERLKAVMAKYGRR